MEKVKRIQWRISTLSSLQVDSISSMGGGHVDGAGLVVQFKEAVNTTPVTIADGITTTLLTLNFTPKFSDSLILCQGFHSRDRAESGNNLNYCHCFLYAGTTEVGGANGVGHKITKSAEASFQYSYSGSIASWGTTSKAIDLQVRANGDWTVSLGGFKTSLYVWEIAQ